MLYLFKTLLEQFKECSEIEKKIQGFPIYPPVHTCPASSVIKNSRQSGTFLNNYHQSPQFTLRFILGVVHSIGLDKGIMTCICHYRLSWDRDMIKYKIDSEHLFSLMPINNSFLDQSRWGKALWKWGKWTEISVDRQRNVKWGKVLLGLIHMAEYNSIHILSNFFRFLRPRRRALAHST